MFRNSGRAYRQGYFTGDTAIILAPITVTCPYFPLTLSWLNWWRGFDNALRNKGYAYRAAR